MDATRAPDRRDGAVALVQSQLGDGNGVRAGGEGLPGARGESAGIRARLEGQQQNSEMKWHLVAIVVKPRPYPACMALEHGTPVAQERAIAPIVRMAPITHHVPT